MIVDMLQYYKVISDANIDIIYSGPLWADGIEGIGGTLRKRMQFDELTLSASQAVFSIFVEQMNNMLMYSEEKQHFDFSDNRHQDVPKGIFLLGIKDKTYFVQSGNVMKTEKTEEMKNKIDYLNSLDKTGLRKYYKEQIKKEQIDTDSKGGGIGLIEIARRANSKIEYTFTPLDNKTTFFSMFVTIEQGGKR